MKKILVAVDRSAASLRAVDLALDLANKYDADLILLAVVRSIPGVDPVLEQYARSEHISGAPTAVVIESARQSLGDLCDRAREKGAHAARAEVVVGEPADEILAFAQSTKPDLIVMGSRGHGRLTGLLLGSVAQKVTGLASCPVLVVH
jgi:nucleotide-binding universal stress UspA family protein